MSDQPLLVRTPAPGNAPLKPIKPPPDLATLARVKDALVRLPCQS
jgi:hypothetical protein